MKKIALTLAAVMALACALALAGCGISLGGYDFGSGTVQVDGKTLTVTLDGNPTTGYEWAAAIEGDSATETSHDYAADSNGTTGSGGTYTFVYEGAKKGTTHVTYTYARSWESTDADQTVEMDITTNDSGKVTDVVTTCSDGSSGELHI